MTSVEFINYFAPRPTLVLTFVVLFCFALFFAYLIAFKNATKGKNYIITFFVFIIIILIGVVLPKSQDNITKANRLSKHLTISLYQHMRSPILKRPC